MRGAEIAFQDAGFVFFIKSNVLTLKLRKVVSNAQDIQGEYQVITAGGIQLSTKVTLTING